jgi:hypothetical protein
VGLIVGFVIWPERSNTQDCSLNTAQKNYIMSTCGMVEQCISDSGQVSIDGVGTDGQESLGGRHTGTGWWMHDSLGLMRTVSICGLQGPLMFQPEYPPSLTLVLNHQLSLST